MPPFALSRMTAKSSTSRTGGRGCRQHKDLTIGLDGDPLGGRVQRVAGNQRLRDRLDAGCVESGVERAAGGEPRRRLNFEVVPLDESVVSAPAATTWPL